MDEMVHFLSIITLFKVFFAAHFNCVKTGPFVYAISDGRILEEWYKSAFNYLNIFRERKYENNVPTKVVVKKCH